MILLLQYTLIFASVLLLVALGGCFSEHSGVIYLCGFVLFFKTALNAWLNRRDEKKAEKGGGGK